MWHTCPQSHSTNNYTLHIQRQFISTSIHWHFPSKQILVLRAEQQIFPHPVPQTHITVNNEWYSKAHKHWLIFLQVGETCVATDSQIRVSALLLPLMVGNWSLRCFGGLQIMTSYIMIFGQPVQQMKRTHRQTDSTVLYIAYCVVYWKKCFLKSNF